MRNYSICREGDKLALYIDNQFYTYGEKCKELEAIAMKVKAEDSARLYEDWDEEEDW